MKSINLTQKKIYNNKVFSKLRNLTRYTFPETVDAKNRLEKLNILKNLNDKVVKLKKLHNKIEVKTLRSGTLRGDIVVNVSGPVSLFKNQSEVPFLKSLKKGVLNPFIPTMLSPTLNPALNALFPVISESIVL